MIDFTTTPRHRGELMILTSAAVPNEVIYRTRQESHIVPLMGALSVAVERGAAEKRRGWPKAVPERSPIFVIIGGPGAYDIIERHPRLSFADRRIYQTDTHQDALLALQAVRRAASLGSWIER